MCAAEQAFMQLGKAMANIFSDVPANLPDEVFEEILSTRNIRIERILSYGHRSPDVGWYDQVENEWVMVLKGQGA
jgi:cupin 2 domain-containing protein